MKLTRQQAINEKCKDCIYDSLAGGTWREQTTACASEDCALWEYRPLDAKTKTAMREEKLTNMTDEEREAYIQKGLEAAKRMGAI